MSLPQPVPPAFKDLGKSSNDLLSKDYPISGNQLEVKTTTPNGVTFRVNGLAASSGAITALGEAKYADRKNGLTFTQSWTHDNKLNTLVELADSFAKGLKVDLATTLQPAKGAAVDEKARHTDKTALLTAAYKLPGFNSKATLDVFKGPTVTADAIIGHNGFLLGGEASYNVTTGKIDKYAAGVGFSAPEYAVALLAADKFKNYAASYYHRVSRDVEAGAKATYKTSDNKVVLEVGSKTYLDSAAFIKAKINNSGVLTLGYTQALRPGVKASFGVQVETAKLNGPHDSHAHKVGASFVFEG